MPAPDTFIEQAEIERAITPNKLVQLLPKAGSPRQVDEKRLRDCLLDATGQVRGVIQVQIKPKSVAELWDTWTEADRAEIRRLTKSCAIYYVHYYGERTEEVPEDVQKDYERTLEQLEQFADRLRTLGADTSADTSRQYVAISPFGVGKFPEGESLRGSFSRGPGGLC